MRVKIFFRGLLIGEVATLVAAPPTDRVVVDIDLSYRPYYVGSDGPIVFVSHPTKDRP